MKKVRIIRLFLATFVFLNISGTSRAGDIENSGDVLQYALPIAAYGMAMYHKDKEGSVQFTKGLLSNIGATWALKLAVNRTRPDGRKHSFPSAHTSVSFAAATFIHKRYGLKQAILPYITATYVGWTRYEVEAHHASDVFAGAAIGMLAGWYFTTPFEKQDVTVTPVPLDGGGYVQVSKRW